MAIMMELLKFDSINPMNHINHKAIGKKNVLLHWHEAVEIAYIAKGSPRTLAIKDQRFILGEGDIYIINSGLIHGFDTTITENQQIITLLINYDWLYMESSQVLKRKNFYLLKRPQDDSYLVAFNRLKNMINKIKEFQDHNINEDGQIY